MRVWSILLPLWVAQLGLLAALAGPEWMLRNAVFLSVARNGSFGRAAHELLVTQPAVSERIGQLERVVGRPLFDRTARGCTLTPSGIALLPYAERCLALAGEAIEVAREAEGVPRLVIAVHSTFAPRVVPFVLGALAARPHRVVVRDAHSEVVPRLVLDGTANVGFALARSEQRGLSKHALPPDPVVCAVGASHPLAGRPKAPFAVLAESLVAVNAWGVGASGFLERLRAGGVDEWRIRECGDAATAIRLARDHDHVAFVAASALHRADKLRTVALPGLSRWTIRLELLHRRTEPGDDAIGRIVARLRGA